MIEQAGGTLHWLQTPGGLTLRAAHWPAGSRGTALFLNGRTEFIEKYLEPVAALQSRGFAVWTLDWRGQGLSSRLLPDPLANHVGHFDDYLADLDLLLDRHVLPAAPGPLILLAHSMGGNLAARMLARRPTLFARAILSAPMIGFRTPLPRPLARSLILFGNLLPAQSTRYGPGTLRRPPLDRPFEGNPLTTDAAQYAGLLSLLRDNPSLQVGGATWGWLRAASDSIDILDQPETIRRIQAPVLIATAGIEHFVDNRATQSFAGRLLHSETLTLPEARHELLREQDRHRQPLWAAIDRFLEPITAR